MPEATDRPITVEPTRAGTTVATGAIGAATVALIIAGIPAALIPGAIAVAAILVGLRRTHRRAITAGGVSGGTAVIVAGALGGRTIPVLAATAGVVLAWDAAETVVTNGQQVGSATGTTATERTHLVATAGVLFVSSGTAYGIYRLSRGGLSTATVLALLAGGVLLLLALRQ